MNSKILIIFSQLLTVFGNTGPIGYQLFRDVNRVSELRTGVHTKQFSSFDRKGGNADGGPFACLSTAGGKCILAEHLGSGEIDSIWMTRDNGVFTKNGKIVIELDGKVVLDAQHQAVLNGELGPPFVWPFVGNGDDTSGGGVIKVPMPYKQSMKITVDTNPNYYHVTYRTFADSADVQTFDPKDKAEDVIEMLRAFGVKDPKPVKMDTKRASTRITNNSAGSEVLFETKSSGEIREIRIQIPSLTRSPRNIDDFRAFAKQGSSSFEVAIDPNNTRVRITRRLDPNVANEIAAITIDGVAAGHWNSTNIHGKDNWGEEQVVIDHKLTKGKSSIAVKQDFISSAFDFNEFRYDVESLVNEQWIRTDVIDVGPDHPGEEKAHKYQIKGQTFAGQRVFRYAEDPKKVQDSDQFLSTTRIRATFDGTVTVDAPFGLFFGSGLGMYDTRKVWFSIDARNGMFRTFWPMPFAREAKVELVFGEHSSDVSDITADVDYVLNDNMKTQLESKKLGYFYAIYREETTTPGKDYVFINTTGRGVFYGVSASMRGLIKTGNLRDYLEGDERVFIDDKRTPEIYGTGTEDFFESGWYFRGGITYDMPLVGNPGYETKGDDCLYDCTDAIRLFAGGVSFESSLLFGIEHGPVDDNEPGIYSSVSYYYKLPDPVLKQTDLITVTDKESRTQHNYTADVETTYQMNSSYEGQNYKVIEASTMTSATKQITFTATIDTNNIGVRLFRTSDQNTADQCVDVYADDKLVGRWLQPLGNQWSRFLDDSYDIPSGVSKGKTRLNVKLVVVSHNGGPSLWTASHYKVLSIVQ